MNNIANNVKKVMIVFFIIFIGLISYIAYFEIITAPKIINSPYNRRMWAKRNKVDRGTIYDRNLKELSVSTRSDDNVQKRKYLGGEAFAHVLGYVDIKYGISGLENSYDNDLIGENSEGIIDYITRKGLGIEKKGDNIVTTLDYNLQKKAYDLLGNNKGAVIALDPITGEILAMVSKPSFNPNDLDSKWQDILENEDRPLLNRALMGLYPPGSVFKTITAISAIENIEDITKRTFNDEGVLVFNDKESLKNYKNKALGNINLEEAYVNSSNVVFGTIGIELGNKELLETAEKFYFNKNIPAEGISIENSRFPIYKKNEKGNIAQSGIGQSEVLVTPMEMALVTSVVANDGVLMKPTLLKKVVDNEGKDIRLIQPEILDKIINVDVAKTIKEYMRKTVESGTGKSANIQGLSICGKTGTADHDDKPLIDEEPHSWFTAFAPYKEPKIVVSVIVEEGGTGGGKAASIAANLIKEYLK